jgi:formate-dependent nitrite reductase membrane component NrfD
MLVLSVIFGVAAVSDYRRAGAQWTILAKMRRRMAIIFGIVGAALVAAYLGLL